MKGFKAHDMYLGENNKKWSHEKPSGKHAHVVAKNETAHKVLMNENSPYDKALVGNQHELPGFLKEKIEASPVKKQTGYRHKKSGVYVPGGPSPYDKKDCTCWKGHSRVRGTKPCAKGSCKKN